MAIDTLEACRVVHRHRGAAIVVSTMTAMKAMDSLAPEAPLTLSSVPLMGGCGGLAAGLALAQPARRVVALDGDASLLMELGVLATVAGSGAANLVHVVFANGVQFNGNANLPLGAQGRVDFAACARACGYRDAVRFERLEDFADAWPQWLGAPGPVLVELAIAPDAPALGPGRPFPEQPDKRFERMGREARAMMAALGVSP